MLILTEQTSMGVILSTLQRLEVLFTLEYANFGLPFAVLGALLSCQMCSVSYVR